MNSQADCYELKNGVKIPCIGFGTWRTEGEATFSAVKEAVAQGYRHIDTAAAYRNEESVGKAVRQSGVPRKELFVTSKLPNDAHGYDEALEAFGRTLERLGLAHLDLYLIHWPNPVKYRDCWQRANAGAWKAFEELYCAGKIRAIGVSNFREHHLDELMKTAKIAPMVDQLRLCPGETQESTAACCRERGILLEAYSPLGAGQAFQVPELAALAEKYGKSVAQICIRWSLQMGFLPLPKSTAPGRIRENADVFGFELSPEDVRTISGLTGRCGTSRDPDAIEF